jgi:uncharacterized membrane protein
MTRTAVLVIVGMGAVTYLTRVSGLWLGDRVGPHPRFDAVLAALPGAILVSLIAPGIIDAGIPGLVAALVAVLAALRWRGSILLPMLLGVLVVWTLRTF